MEDPIAVTLNGQPAVLGGFGERFATVRTLDGRTSHEYRWSAVRITLGWHSGEFKS